MLGHKLLLGLFAIFALSVMGTISAAENEQPSGTFKFHGEEFKVLIGGGGGSGTLTFEGQEYQFSLKGLTGGGVGAEDIDAWGDVYNLSDPNQFAGTYGEVAAGITAAQDSMGKVLWVQNENGVKLAVHTKTEGLALGVEADGFVVTLKE